MIMGGRICVRMWGILDILTSESLNFFSSTYLLSCCGKYPSKNGVWMCFAQDGKCCTSTFVMSFLINKSPHRSLKKFDDWVIGGIFIHTVYGSEILHEIKPRSLSHYWQILDHQFLPSRLSKVIMVCPSDGFPSHLWKALHLHSWCF